MQSIKANVWMLAVVMLVVKGAGLQAADADKADAGFASMFDGKTLDQWDGDPKLWRVENGAIVGETTRPEDTQGNTFLIWKGGDVGDFVMTWQYRLTAMDKKAPFSNSGVQFRSFKLPDDGPNRWRVGGYQADMEAGPTFTGGLYGEATRGILASRGQKTTIKPGHKQNAAPEVIEPFADAAELQKHIKADDWNACRVTVKGYQIVFEINGVKMCECIDEDPKMRSATGIVALQLHHGPAMKCEFRELKIKRLD